MGTSVNKSHFVFGWHRAVTPWAKNPLKALTAGLAAVSWTQSAGAARILTQAAPKGFAPPAPSPGALPLALVPPCAASEDGYQVTFVCPPPPPTNATALGSQCYSLATLGCEEANVSVGTLSPLPTVAGDFWGDVQSETDLLASFNAYYGQSLLANQSSSHFCTGCDYLSLSLRGQDILKYFAANATKYSPSVVNKFVFNQIAKISANATYWKNNYREGLQMFTDMFANSTNVTGWILGQIGAGREVNLILTPENQNINQIPGFNNLPNSTQWAANGAGITTPALNAPGWEHAVPGAQLSPLANLTGRNNFVAAVGALAARYDNLDDILGNNPDFAKQIIANQMPDATADELGKPDYQAFNFILGQLKTLAKTYPQLWPLIPVTDQSLIDGLWNADTEAFAGFVAFKVLNNNNATIEDFIAGDLQKLCANVTAADQAKVKSIYRRAALFVTQRLNRIGPVPVTLTFSDNATTVAVRQGDPLVLNLRIGLDSHFTASPAGGLGEPTIVPKDTFDDGVTSCESTNLVGCYGINQITYRTDRAKIGENDNVVVLDNGDITFAVRVNVTH